MNTENNTTIYKNTGRTLTLIAKAILVLGSLASIGLAYAVGSLTETLGREELCSAVSCFTLIVGVLLSYLSGLMLAALGELVCSIHSIKQKKLKINLKK